MAEGLFALMFRDCQGEIFLIRSWERLNEPRRLRGPGRCVFGPHSARAWSIRWLRPSLTQKR